MPLVLRRLGEIAQREVGAREGLDDRRLSLLLITGGTATPGA